MLKIERNIFNMDQSADIAIVGAGIVGLAHACMSLRKGHKVVLFERDEFPVGATVRNFGLIWPIGQEPGQDLERALRSRIHWQQLSREAGFWLHDNGSLHLAYHEDEMEVLAQFLERSAGAGYQCSLIDADEVIRLSPMVNPVGLLGGLFSRSESTVYSRDAVKQLLHWLQETKGLTVIRGTAVTEVSFPYIKTAGGKWKADKIFVCSGADFETLYPSVFQEQGLVKCRLQMMKARIAGGFPQGPSLCAGLTLRHYKAFSECASLPRLNARYDALEPRFREHGIHVLVSSNPAGELILGDSHHYGQTFEPFDREEVNELILGYLKTFTRVPDLQIVQRWHGVYPKLHGKTFLRVDPEPGVTIVNGLGGAGMTLSFGIAEEIVNML